MHTIPAFEVKELGNIRIAMIDGRPWFVGNDVARNMGYKDPSRAVRSIVKEENKLRGICSILDSRGCIQFPVMINESGLFSLGSNGHRPVVKQFTDWMAKAVIPAFFRNVGNAYDLELLTNSLTASEPPDSVFDSLFNWFRTVLAAEADESEAQAAAAHHNGKGGVTGDAPGKEGSSSPVLNLKTSTATRT